MSKTEIARMRLLHIITGLGPGGAENLLLDVAGELAARGVRQKVLFFFGEAELMPAFEKLGISAVRIDWQKGRFIRAVRRVRREILAFHPSAVHTHLPRADLAGRAACLTIPGLPCFTTIHNMDTWRRKKALRFRLLSLFDRLTINRVHRMRLIACAECCRRYVIEHTGIRPDKITTNTNCAAPKPQKKGAEITRRALGIPEDAPVLINVGRLCAQKCQMDIIDAARRLKDIGDSNARFLILGEGELRPDLERAIRTHGLSDMVRLIGFVPNVYDYFAISDAFLLTSAYEGSSIALLEAFLNRLPVIATDIASTREMLAGGASMLLVPLHDPQAIADTVLSIEKGETALDPLTGAAYAYAAALTPAAYVDKLLEIYRLGGVR